MIKTNDSVYDLKADVFCADSLVSSDKWRIHYPVYHFECEDINNDGVPEIAVGVIKHTRYDSISRKRLFIFKLYEGKYIRPLWLGSRVSYPLVDFRIVGKSGDKYFRTIEQNGENSFVVAEYRLDAFGLKWLRYVQENIDSKTAKKLFNK
ncbi:MAG: nuclear receptor-binding factor 2 [Paludibacter sp.]|nr:nuclear receptor-binding factor 2 [Paludibacter sp.]